jgi:hypothetical protein
MLPLSFGCAGVDGPGLPLLSAPVPGQVFDSWEQYGLFGLSEFGAVGDDLVALSDAVTQIRRRPDPRLARCGGLRSARFEDAATFSNPLHFSVVLPDATPWTFAALRSCFSEPVANPGFQRDR